MRFYMFKPEEFDLDAYKANREAYLEAHPTFIDGHLGSLNLSKGAFSDEVTEWHHRAAGAAWVEETEADTGTPFGPVTCLVVASMVGAWEVKVKRKVHFEAGSGTLLLKC
jgi:hypothetical protein